MLDARRPAAPRRRRRLPRLRRPGRPPLLPGVGRVSADLPSVDLTAASAFVAATKFDVAEAERHRASPAPSTSAPTSTPRGASSTAASTARSSSRRPASARARRCVDRGQFAVGVNNNTDFLRPMTSGRARRRRRADPAGPHPPALAGRPDPRRRRQAGRPRARCGCRTCRCRAPRPAPPGRAPPGTAPAGPAGWPAGARPTAGTTRSQRAGRRCGSSSRPWKR